MSKMTFNWSHFLDLANLLNNISQTTVSSTSIKEALFRSAISRSYYAAFRTTRDELERRNLYNPHHSGIDHQNVKKKSDLIDPLVKANLIRLQQLRTFSDYDCPFPPTENLDIRLVQDSIRKANTILNILSQKSP